MEFHVKGNDSLFSERPVLRITGNPTRDQWAAAALRDCEKLLHDDDTIHVGLGLLKEFAERWPDLPAAAEAKALLDDYHGRDPRPWVEFDKRERLDGTRVLATTYDQAAFSKGTLAKTPRAVYTQAAIRNYSVLVEEESDPKFVAEAKNRIEALQVMADTLPKQPPRKMDNRSAKVVGNQDNARVLDTRFSHEGPFILRDLLDHLRVELLTRDVELQVDEEAIDRAALSVDVRVPLKFDEEQLRDILRFALPKAGLEYRCLGSSIRITPAKRSDSPE